MEVGDFSKPCQKSGEDVYSTLIKSSDLKWAVGCRPPQPIKRELDMYSVYRMKVQINGFLPKEITLIKQG